MSLDGKVIWHVWAGQTAGHEGRGLPVTGLAEWDGVWEMQVLV